MKRDLAIEIDPLAVGVNNLLPEKQVEKSYKNENDDSRCD